MIYLLILIIEIFIFSLIDKKIYKSYYTPTFFLSIPFFIIVLLYLIFSDRLGYKTLNYDVLLIWIFGLFFFWISGLFTFIITQNKKNNFQYQSIDIARLKAFNKKSVNFTIMISFVILFYCYNGYKIYISSGGDATEKYLGSGLIAHLSIIYKFLAILSFLVIRFKGDKILFIKNLFIIVVSILLSFLYATKSGILLLLLGFIFSRILYFNIKIKIWHVLLLLCFSYLVFLISYSVSFGFQAPFEFINNHILIYYVSGVASMSAYFSDPSHSIGLDKELLFRPLFNYIYVFSGNPENVKVAFSDIWTDIGNDTRINVKTIFGTTYLYGGLLIGILSTFIYSFITYNFFFLALKKNIIGIVFYSQIISMLIFGWFDIMFNTVMFYESLFLSLILVFLTKHSKKSNGK
ncbi:oligosaccharide repeat unit polymerase [Empedobacter falsenii]